MKRFIGPSLLVASSALLGSIPVIAVVSHKRNPPEPMIYPVVRNPNAMLLYTPAGDQVAVCDQENSEKATTLTRCKISDGATLDDVMNAWLRAYEDK